ncbi:MAG: HAD family hydrolase [Oscillospiraceae bacterium]|nr:HAD family hydrolase [Oscillospiraceae bacterium]
MTKTLYISDLDGTLLNEHAKLSAYSEQVLHDFTQSGGLFSVATARTWESFRYNKILDPALLSVPVVLMNGALIYDAQRECYVKKELIAPQTVQDMLACMKAHDITGLLYENTDSMRVYHAAFALQSVLADLAGYREKLFEMTQTDNPPMENIVGMSTVDARDALLPLYEALQQLPELNCLLYPCAYEAGHWYLECYAHSASKRNAVQWLRETYDFDKIVGFGDNLNDLPLFRACDESYAVANAREELKAAATGVIGANNEDGVARYLAQTR